MNENIDGNDPAVSTVAANPSKGRRERLERIEHDFTHAPVKVGTQQATAIEKIRLSSQSLAKLISELGPETADTEWAIKKVMEAKMWATHAISHRR